LPLGKHEIEGDKVFALVQEYSPKPRAVGKFEAHERYWDVQFVARGAERMGWVVRSRLAISEPYDAAREVMFFESSPYSGIGDFFLVAEGFFTVFGPQDVHMPGVAIAENTASDAAFSAAMSGPTNLSVRKVVVKVDPA
jgi:YhcH/YjgK/YiaL family protein